MRKIITSIVLAVAALTAIPAQSAVLVTSTTTQVQNIRLESGYGYVGVVAPFSGCSRVYMDMSVAIWQQYFAISKMAWVTGDNIVIRAYNDILLNGACQAFDIIVQH